MVTCRGLRLNRPFGRLDIILVLSGGIGPAGVGPDFDIMGVPLVLASLGSRRALAPRRVILCSSHTPEVFRFIWSPFHLFLSDFLPFLFR